MKDKNKIYNLIDKYFGGETSLEEERELLNLLRLQKKGDPRIDSALAVMSFSRLHATEEHELNIHRNKGRKIPQHLFLRSSVAACIITILIFGGYFFLSNESESGDSRYLAYINGTKISDKSFIQSFVKTEFSEMAAARMELSEEIDDNLEIFKTPLNNLTNPL